MVTDTYAFQARTFYERLGFEVFGQIDGPAPMFPRVVRAEAPPGLGRLLVCAGRRLKRAARCPIVMTRSGTVSLSEARQR